MFHFDAKIIKRRRVKKNALFIGLLSAALLGYSGLTFLEIGHVPFLEKIANQIGVTQYMQLAYVALFITLFLLILPSIYTIFKKKTVLGGHVSFDEEKLEIVKGKEKYIIPEEDLTQLSFDLKALPKGNKKKKNQLFGGSYIKYLQKKEPLN